MNADQSFTRLFQASPAPFLVIRPDAPRFTIAEVNDAYLAATMRRREDLVGRGVFEAFPDNPNDAAIAGVGTLRASLERVLATRQPDRLADLKYDVARPDGTFEERWWNPVNSPVLDAHGHVEAIIHNANDVTDTHRAVADLRESEALRRIALAGGRMGTWRWNLRDRLVWGDAEFLALWGVVPSDQAFPLALFTERMSPEGQAEMETVVTRAIEQEEAFDGQLEVVGGPTAGQWVRWRGRAKRDEPWMLHGVSFNVTEQRRAEARLRESEERYHALFAASPVPFMVFEPNPPDFTITAANDAYLATTLTTRETLIGRRLFDVFTDDPSRPGEHGSDALAVSLDRVLATRRTDAMPRVRYDIVTRPGGPFEPHWWLAINAPMLDARGEITAILHQVQRVTELHLAEEAEREHRERQAFLLRLSDALRPLGDPVAIKATAASLLGELLAVNRAFYADAEAAHWHVTRGHERGVEPLPDAPFEMATYGQWIIDSFQAGQRLVVDDMAVDPRFAESERAAQQRLQIGAAAALPLVKDGALLAMLVVHDRQPRRWSAHELTLLEEVAERTWAAVERARAEEALRAALGEREGLLKELHHRVKNNLQVITSLLEMQARQIHDPAAVAALAESRHRITAIASIHELLYQEGTFSQVEFGAYARELVPRLVAFYDAQDRIKPSVVGGSVLVDLDFAVPCGLLLNELVSNACKHAFPPPATGELTVTLAQDDAAIRLDVRDDGVGLPAGFDPQKSPTLGLQLVHLLVRQLGGSVAFGEGGGMHTKVQVPKRGQQCDK